MEPLALPLWEQFDRPSGVVVPEEVEVPGVSVVIDMAVGKKCMRCWQVLPDVGASAEHNDICGRCTDAVNARPVVPE